MKTREQQSLNIHKEVLTNIEAAQEKQKKDFINRKTKHVKSFLFSPGELVLRRNMAKKTKVGDKLQKEWQGPYKILKIDQEKR